MRMSCEGPVLGRARPLPLCGRAWHTQSTQETCTANGCVATTHKTLWPKVRQLPTHKSRP